MREAIRGQSRSSEGNQWAITLIRGQSEGNHAHQRCTMRRTHCISDGELCISDGELCISVGELCISVGELCISEGPMASAGAAAPLPAPAAAPTSSTASSVAVAPAGRDMFRDMPPSSTASSAAVAPAGQWRPVASQRASASNSARAEVGTIRRCGTRLRAPSIREAARCGEHLHARQAIRMQSTYLRSVRRRKARPPC